MQDYAFFRDTMVFKAIAKSYYCSSFSVGPFKYSVSAIFSITDGSSSIGYMMFSFFTLYFERADLFLFFFVLILIVGPFLIANEIIFFDNSRESILFTRIYKPGFLLTVRV